MKKIYLPLSLIIVGLSILTPIIIYLLTRYSLMPLSPETGFIGDTIGGITSPLLNGIAICFLYITFRQQRDASLEQERLDNFKVIMQLFEQLYNDLNNYRYTTEDRTYHGSEGLIVFVRQLKQKNSHDIRSGINAEKGYKMRLKSFKLSAGGMDIVYLFQSFQIIQRQISLVDQTPIQRQILKDKLTILFKSKMFFLGALVPLFGELEDEMVLEIKKLINSFE